MYKYQWKANILWITLEELVINKSTSEKAWVDSIFNLSHWAESQCSYYQALAYELP